MFWLCFFRTFKEVSHKCRNADGGTVKALSATLKIRGLRHDRQSVATPYGLHPHTA